MGVTGAGFQNFPLRLQTEIGGKKAKKLDFYFGIKLASWARTELTGSKYTPPDASKPSRTAGGGYMARLKRKFSTCGCKPVFAV